MTGPCEVPEFAALAVVEDDGETRGLWGEEEETLGPAVAESRRTAFRLGRRAAHQALAVLALDNGPILKGEGGQPMWPEGAVGSITNKPTVAAALVASDSDAMGIGVDLEFLRPVREIESIVLLPEEASWVSSAGGTERDNAVVAVFAAKEAIFKALYPVVGHRFGFEAATLQPRAGGFDARLTEDLHPWYQRNKRLHVETCWDTDWVLCWVVIRRGEGVEAGDAANR